jgi:pterin-4a-carbinolamine dehydratase
MKYAALSQWLHGVQGLVTRRRWHFHERQRDITRNLCDFKNFERAKKFVTNL